MNIFISKNTKISDLLKASAGVNLSIRVRSFKKNDPRFSTLEHDESVSSAFSGFDLLAEAKENPIKPLTSEEMMAFAREYELAAIADHHTIHQEISLQA